MVTHYELHIECVGWCAQNRVLPQASACSHVIPPRLSEASVLISQQERGHCTYDEYGAKTHHFSIYEKHISFRTCATQLVINGTMYTYMVFLDPYIKGFLFANFFCVNAGCVFLTEGPNCIFFHVFGLSKAINFELP